LLLTLGLGLALISLWALSELTGDVVEGDTAQFDRAALLSLNEFATPSLDRVALAVTGLANTLPVILLAVAIAVLLVLLGHQSYAVLMAIAVSGGAVISSALKAVFDRPRPQLIELSVDYAASSAAYPSGHATMSMVTLSALAFIIHRLGHRTGVSLLAFMIAALLMLLIGLSRLYLGVHYPTDVMAGYAVGFIWVVLSAIAAEQLRWRQELVDPRLNQSCDLRSPDKNGVKS
jgi:membrane-associated phospholipid phosphatase